MIIMPLQFAIGFMFLCALLLLGVIYSRIHWVVKAVLVVSSLVFCIFTYNGYKSTLGYPVVTKPPSIFQLIYPDVHEPVLSKNDPGAIYLWIVDPTGREEPRAIAIPYSKKNRDMASQAKKKIKDGEQVYMSLKPSKDGVEGDDDSSMGTPGNGKKTGDNKGGSGNNTVPYHLNNEVLDFEQPADTLPRKVDSDP